MGGGWLVGWWLVVGGWVDGWLVVGGWWVVGGRHELEVADVKPKPSDREDAFADHGEAERVEDPSVLWQPLNRTGRNEHTIRIGTITDQLDNDHEWARQFFPLLVSPPCFPPKEGIVGPE